MKADQLRAILDAIHHVTVAVYGDFCLDAYWILDSGGGEISVETGLQAEAVRRQYYTLGGASNVVANVAALKPARLQVVGVIGDDIFGREMQQQFHALGVDTSRLTIQKEKYDTVVFGKRYLNDLEQPRIDFGFLNQRSLTTDEQIIENLRAVLQACDALIFNQQVPGSLSEQFVEMANAVFDDYQDKIIILDSRHYGEKFRNIIRKTNDIEAAHLAGDMPGNGQLTTGQLEKIGMRLFAQFQKPVFLTRGDRGILAIDASGIRHVPGIHFMKKLDTVGAGDTVISALAAALAAGFPPAVAAEFANLAAGVTVQKLFQTGTASGQEIEQLNAHVYFIHQPELAEDQRNAHFFKSTHIERCFEDGTLDLGGIKHIIFDHDGTISTLREGWDAIMQKVMVKCILADKYNDIDVAEYERIMAHVREYIDMTAGIQTIVQMEGLVEMVKEFGHVPAEKIKTNFEYKQIYNEALLHVVRQRIQRLKDHELNADDFTIKGVTRFLEKLRQKDVTLYLASGTDHDDVQNEAGILGYAALFNGGIFGAVGDVAKFSKRLLIEKIVKEFHLNGPELAVFGDGPVELQECRKYAGIAIGVASDEIRRYGLNIEKRTRLIKAGAHFIIPDYSQGNQLCDILFPSLVN
ncbi:HAD hydrolase-like protein [candidate division KSB1 bacterium]|nr:HAD hydrolase-like protein [candidate division KSB1 bacterium]